MLTKGQTKEADKFMELLRGYGFLAFHTRTGWVAMHLNGHVVTGNAKRLKFETYLHRTDEGMPVVRIQRGPVESAWLDARAKEVGL